MCACNWQMINIPSEDGVNCPMGARAFVEGFPTHKNAAQDMAVVESVIVANWFRGSTLKNFLAFEGSRLRGQVFSPPPSFFVALHCMGLKSLL